MAEPYDAVILILRNIQDRLATNERRTDAGLGEIKEKLLELHTDMADLKNLVTYGLGLTNTHSDQPQEIRNEVDQVKARLAKLETTV